MISSRAKETAPARILCCLILAFACLFAASLLGGCGGGQAEPEQEAEQEQVEEQASYIPHGSTYEKAETVSVVTDYGNTIKAVSVEDWIKNPDELATISDVSTLDNIVADNEDVSFTQDGSSLEWTTAGNDIHYTGTSDKELPFEISYGFLLDGSPIDASELKDVTGKLEIHISYKNNATDTITVNGSSKDIRHPYVMASLIAFDTEHATNIDVDNGTVLDQGTNVIAAGVAMPGLAGTLGLEDQLDLPTSVTITADVKGFDMPAVTTMVTDQALNAFDESRTADLEESIDDVFGNLENIKKATDGLSQGTEGISAALGQITDGQKAMMAAIPNAEDGLSKLSDVAGQLGTTVDGAKQQISTSSDKQAEALDELNALRETLPEESPELQSVDSAIAALEDAGAANDSADQALAGAGQMAQGLNDGLEGAAAGIKQMQEGSENLSKALEQVTEASGQLSSGAEALNKGVKQALSSARNTIDSKLDLVDALREYVQDQGAWTGSADGMSASTTFIVKAEA